MFNSVFGNDFRTYFFISENKDAQVRASCFGNDVTFHVKYVFQSISKHQVFHVKSLQKTQKPAILASTPCASV